VLFRGRPSADLPVADRVQIWAGLVPLAGYLVVHLCMQAAALWGAHSHGVWASGEPRLSGLVLELGCIYLPLALHVGLGVRRLVRPSAASGLPETSPDAPPGAADAQAWLARLIQPTSGGVLLIFLVVHVLEFRVPLWTGALAPSDYYPELCASLSSTRWGGIPLVALGYLLGLGAAALHGAHGLYHGALRLGLVAPPRQRLWANCCSALGLALFGLGALIVVDLATGSVLIHLSGS
jgi:succinate dehydrogenase / fumarate reductase cytochrome b subunit